MVTAQLDLTSVKVSISLQPNSTGTPIMLTHNSINRFPPLLSAFVCFRIRQKHLQTRAPGLCLVSELKHINPYQVQSRNLTKLSSPCINLINISFRSAPPIKYGWLRSSVVGSRGAMKRCLGGISDTNMQGLDILPNFHFQHSSPVSFFSDASPPSCVRFSCSALELRSNFSTRFSPQPRQQHQQARQQKGGG